MKRIWIPLLLLVGNSAFAEEGPDLSHCVEDSRTNILIIGFDRHKLNYGCAADAYQAAGMYEMASRMRCKIDEIRHRFLEIEDCVRANIHIPLELETPMVAQVEERHEEDVQLLQQQVQALENELEEVQNREPEPVQAPAPVIVQQEFLSESKKDKLRALKEEK
jgi:hypothetical protein